VSPTRREFLKLSTLLAGGAALAPRSLSALSRSPGWGSGADALRRNEFTLLRRDVGIFTARGGTVGWLVTSDGVVVVDSQFPDSAELLATGLRERDAPRIDVLFNSHHHRDHTGGNGVLRPLAERIVAHERVPELQRVYAEEAPQTYPDTTFRDEWSVQVGSETVRARHYGPAHTGGDATLFFQEANVVHMGDLINNRGYAFIDPPAGASIRGWIGLLEAVMAEHDGDTLFIFGHARQGFPVVGAREDLGVQRDFFAALLEEVETAVAAGRSVEEVEAFPPLARFPDHQAPPERVAATWRIAWDEVTGG
jgi:cyclase